MVLTIEESKLKRKEYNKNYYKKWRLKNYNHLKEYRKNNHERIKLKIKECNLYHPDKKSIYDNTYYMKNKEKVKQRIAEYYKNNIDKVKEYRRNYYNSNKADWTIYSKKRYYNQRPIIEARKAYFVELKGGKCSKCGGIFPLCCYDFHHVDILSKERRIRFRNPNIEAMKIEIEKCILVCANCHRLEHYKRL